LKKSRRYVSSEKMNAKKYLTVPRFDRIPWLIHGFGTRSWRLRDLEGRPEWRNFKMCWLDQVHSREMHFIDALPDRRLTGDALATRLPGIFLIIKTADCLPLFLVDESQPVIAAVHSGWRGSQKRIAEHAVRELQVHYGCRPSSLLAALGPCIGPECYEVGEDVRQEFEAAGFPLDILRPHPAVRGKYLLDLVSANRRQLESQGLKKKNIFTVGICTHCDNRLLSYRRDRNKTARLFNFIGVKDTHWKNID
jgi:YfiH family protein